MSTVTTNITTLIIKDRRQDESRNAQAARIGLPEPTLRQAERLNRLPKGVAGSLLRAHLGLEAK